MQYNSSFHATAARDGSDSTINFDMNALSHLYIPTLVDQSSIRGDAIIRSIFILISIKLTYVKPDEYLLQCSLN